MSFEGPIQTKAQPSTMRKAAQKEPVKNNPSAMTQRKASMPDAKAIQAARPYSAAKFLGDESIVNGTKTSGSGPVQAKIPMGKPGDRFETEADSMADKVMQMPETGQKMASASGADASGSAQSKPDAPASDVAQRVSRLVTRKEEEGIQASAEEGAAPAQAMGAADSTEKAQTKEDKALPTAEEGPSHNKDPVQSSSLVSRKSDEAAAPESGAAQASLVSRIAGETDKSQPEPGVQASPDPSSSHSALQTSHSAQKEEAAEGAAQASFISRTESEPADNKGPPAQATTVATTPDSTPAAQAKCADPMGIGCAAKDAAQKSDDPAAQARVQTSCPTCGGDHAAQKSDDPAAQARVQTSCPTCGGDHAAQSTPHSALRTSDSAQAASLPALRSPLSAKGGQVPGEVETQINSSKGSGQPMDQGTKGFMENRFGADFSGVRIHNDGNAAAMTGGIKAQAFAHGSDIYFAPGKYNPETSSGKRLLAHELTHTIQQGAAEPAQKKDEDEKASAKEEPAQMVNERVSKKVQAYSCDESNPPGGEGEEEPKEEEAPADVSAQAGASAADRQAGVPDPMSLGPGVVTGMASAAAAKMAGSMPCGEGAAQEGPAAAGAGAAAAAKGGAGGAGAAAAGLAGAASGAAKGAAAGASAKKEKGKEEAAGKPAADKKPEDKKSAGKEAADKKPSDKKAGAELSSGKKAAEAKAPDKDKKETPAADPKAKDKAKPEQKDKAAEGAKTSKQEAAESKSKQAAKAGNAPAVSGGNSADKPGPEKPAVPELKTPGQEQDKDKEKVADDKEGGKEKEGEEKAKEGEGKEEKEGAEDEAIAKGGDKPSAANAKDQKKTIDQAKGGDKKGPSKAVPEGKGEAASPEVREVRDGARASADQGRAETIKQSEELSQIRGSKSEFARLDPKMAGQMGSAEFRKAGEATAAGNAMLTGFVNQSTLQIQQFLDKGRASADAMRTGTAQKRARLESDIAKKRSQTRALMASLRMKAKAGAAASIASINMRHMSSVAAINAKAAASIAQINLMASAATAAVNAKLATQVSAIFDAYKEADVQYKAVGPKVGAEASSRGETIAGQYESKITGKKDGFWDGYLTDNRYKARAKAARETGNQYKEGLTEEAKKQADAGLKGMPQDLEGVQTMAAQTLAGIRCGKDSSIASLNAQKASSIQQANETRTSLTTSVQQGLSSTITSLTEQEHAQMQLLNDYGIRQAMAIERDAESSSAGLLKEVTGGAAQLTAVLKQIRQGAAGARAPPPDKAAGTISGMAAQFSQALGLAGTRVAAATGIMQQGLAAGEAQSLTALSFIHSSGVDGARGIAAGFDATLQGLNQAAAQGYSQLVAGFMQQATAAVTSAQTMFTQAVQGLTTSFTEGLANVKSHLAKAVSDLEAGFIGVLDKDLEPAICKEASKAAAEVQPWWKSVLKILLVIVVIVVVVLVTGPAVLAVAGALAPALGVSAGVATVIASTVVGAVLGGLASGVIQVGNNLIDGKKWNDGLGKAIVIGMIGGAFGGFGGAFAQGLAQAGKLGAGVLMQNVMKFGIETAFDFVGNVIGDLVTEGKVNWTGVLVGMGIGAGLNIGMGGFGFIKGKVTGAVDAGAPKVGVDAPDAPKVEVGAPKTEVSTPKTGDAGTPKTGETTTPKTGETTTPKTGEGGTPKTGETTTPKTGEGGTPKTGETTTPKTGETSTPKTGEGGTPKTGETTTPKTGEGGTPKTGETTTPKTGETPTPKTGETTTPKQGESTTPKSEGGEPDLKQPVTKEKITTADEKPLGTEKGQKVEAEVDLGNGHKRKVLEDGTPVTCSKCTEMGETYKGVLDDPKNAALKAEYDEIKAGLDKNPGDPALNQRCNDLEVKLKAEQDLKLKEGGGEVPKQDGTAPKEEGKTKTEGEGGKKEGETDAPKDESKTKSEGDGGKKEESLVDEKSGKFKDQDLEDRYQEYVKRKNAENKTPRGREDWKKESDYWQNDSPMAQGNKFNAEMSQKYPYNEVYVKRAKVEPGQSDYVRVDSFDPEAGEIISRKHTQLAEVDESTAIKYLDELKKKYPPGSEIADVPSSKDLLNDHGNKLTGQMILEVPTQNAPVPQSVIDAANANGIRIRDQNGNFLN